MRRISRSTGTGVAILAIALASLAQASPIGTPPANRVPTGKGQSLSGLFDDRVASQDAADPKTGDPKTRSGRRHLAAKEWREAYIAKHCHDLPSLAHPGH